MNRFASRAFMILVLLLFAAASYAARVYRKGEHRVKDVMSDAGIQSTIKVCRSDADCCHHRAVCNHDIGRCVRPDGRLDDRSCERSEL